MHADQKQEHEPAFATFFHANRKLCTILLVAFSAMLLSGAYYLGTRANKKGTSAGVAADPNAVAIDDAYLEALGAEPIMGTVQQNYFIHHSFSDLYFKADQLSQEMPAWNDSANTACMIVKLYVGSAADAGSAAGSKELLFTSGSIKPGMMLQSITLAHPLAPGEYLATVVSTPIDASGAEGCSLKSSVRLHVE